MNLCGWLSLALSTHFREEAVSSVVCLVHLHLVLVPRTHLADEPVFQTVVMIPGRWLSLALSTHFREEAISGVVCLVHGRLLNWLPRTHVPKEAVVCTLIVGVQEVVGGSLARSFDLFRLQ